MKKINSKTLINVLGFYICWWLCIYGAIQEMYAVGPLSVLIYMVLHFVYLTNNKIEYLYILICFVLGFLIDTIILKLNIIRYSGFLPDNYNVAPLWVVCLWLCFSLSIFHSFKVLQKRYKESLFLGFVSGPLVYYSFSKIEIITISDSYNILFILFFIAVLWMFLIPFCVFIADQLIKLGNE